MAALTAPLRSGRQWTEGPNILYAARSDRMQVLVRFYGGDTSRPVVAAGDLSDEDSVVHEEDEEDVMQDMATVHAAYAEGEEEEEDHGAEADADADDADADAPAPGDEDEDVDEADEEDADGEDDLAEVDEEDEEEIEEEDDEDEGGD